MEQQTNNQIPQVADLSDVPIGIKQRNPVDYATYCGGNEAEREYGQHDLALHNDRLPSLGVKAENPRHRVILYLKLQGHSNREIAQHTGYCEAHISQITRQPWFRLRLVEMADELGRDACEAFIKGETLQSLYTLVEIRDDHSNKASTRVAAANALLDRALGKPTQKVESEVTHIDATEATTRAEAIDQKLNEINQQLAQHGAN